jgi:lipopolysaccharide biosynthesis glycosyltransferase
MNSIPIFFAADDNFALYVSVAIASICSNTGSAISFYVLDCGISDETKNNIQLMKGIFGNSTIEFIKIDTTRLFAGLPYDSRVSVAAYTRFMIPDFNDIIKPWQYEKQV